MTETAPRPIRVHVYHDYACPYSYVTHVRLSRLRGEIPRLRISWRPLEIRPAIPAGGLPAEGLGEAAEAWREGVRRAGEMAEEMGVPLRPPTFVPNTHDALQAAEFAKDLPGDVFGRLHASLFRAYFAESRDLGDRSVLREVVGEAGADPEALELALEDGRYEEALEEAEAEAERYGISGTPTLLFGRFKVVGAATADVLREAARRAAREG